MDALAVNNMAATIYAQNNVAPTMDVQSDVAPTIDPRILRPFTKLPRTVDDLTKDVDPQTKDARGVYTLGELTKMTKDRLKSIMMHECKDLPTTGQTQVVQHIVSIMTGNVEAGKASGKPRKTIAKKGERKGSNSSSSSQSKAPETAPLPQGAFPYGGNAQPAVLQNGLIQNGCIQNGHIQNGHIQNGCIQNGHIQNGCIQNGHPHNGCIQNGHLQNGQPQDGNIHIQRAQPSVLPTAFPQAAPLAQGGFPCGGNAQPTVFQNGLLQNGNNHLELAQPSVLPTTFNQAQPTFRQNGIPQIGQPQEEIFQGGSLQHTFQNAIPPITQPQQGNQAQAAFSHNDYLWTWDPLLDNFPALPAQQSINQAGFLPAAQAEPAVQTPHFLIGQTQHDNHRGFLAQQNIPQPVFPPFAAASPDNFNFLPVTSNAHGGQPLAPAQSAPLPTAPTMRAHGSHSAFNQRRDRSRQQRLQPYTALPRERALPSNPPIDHQGHIDPNLLAQPAPLPTTLTRGTDGSLSAFNQRRDRSLQQRLEPYPAPPRGRALPSNDPIDHRDHMDLDPLTQNCHAPVEADPTSTFLDFPQDQLITGLVGPATADPIEATTSWNPPIDHQDHMDLDSLTQNCPAPVEPDPTLTFLDISQDQFDLELFGPATADPVEAVTSSTHPIENEGNIDPLLFDALPGESVALSPNLPVVQDHLDTGQADVDMMASTEEVDPLWSKEDYEKFCKGEDLPEFDPWNGFVVERSGNQELAVSS